ncbi:MULTISPECIES: diacylglycerol/lipid kinase family protein [unclassified Arthrobacter]|uniref:diacylglycerol/lipid kinase family protein n=1 Tax=unclassified Arthrobacter TaxID=235627 RepID=UPI001D15111C|nr:MULTISPECIES: YegS/Rv2252/BmrU family lipid kinase [unclassified Arthrobacter]MCC3275804.1 YegS/Rv2252/BmrU family lipid kinase [Arthrobacter sp. zg-Y20]MCC3278771.1 YegS/Rv2252/BmrU family lipid kinase [Arthrobacter sp. zg-Y40]MCC9177145.1 YegS/Rv2252/BmrU family lipid kinase [Arthrobacter sp. zg-Y750]MDK1315961.1 YegS/Rv2252/BmrU family lipid kinase [Arthrobacter sp. zg.Y20]WIB06262.1 YegS/Rv2252/BmrU family lipid kinase [Arthrobacter sp. zg-Y20]
MPVEITLLLVLFAALLASAATWAILAKRSRRRLAAEAAVFAPRGAAHQRVAMVINPIKAQADEARALLEAACELAGWDAPLILETTVDSPGYLQAVRALEAGADVVVAAGGDGTIREVSRAAAHSNASLGLVPLGTGNLLARNLDISVADLTGNVRNALHGDTRRIDMATIQLEDSTAGTASRNAFLVMGGIGLDAEVIAATRDELKKRVGWLAYSEAGVRLLPGRRTRMNISIDDAPVHSQKVHSVLVANTGRLPAGIDFIPDAVVDDGLLDIIIMSPRSVLGWAWVAGKVMTRYPKDLPVIHHHRARKVTVSVAEPTQTQLDGDLTGAATSITVQVDPGALLVRVPQAPALPVPKNRSNAAATA